MSEELKGLGSIMFEEAEETDKTDALRNFAPFCDDEVWREKYNQVVYFPSIGTLYSPHIS